VSNTAEPPFLDPEKASVEAYPLLREAVGSILKGSDEARAAYEALLARGMSDDDAKEEIARVLLATMFHVGAQSKMLERAGGGTRLRREAFRRLAAGETARQIFEAAGDEGRGI
jgi:hypothetical protein